MTTRAMIKRARADPSTILPMIPGDEADALPLSEGREAEDASALAGADGVCIVLTAVDTVGNAVDDAV